MTQHQDPSLGTHLFALRQAKGWSLRQAAKLIGIAHSRLDEIEKGIDSHSGQALAPSYIHVVKIARAYGLAPDQLLKRAGHQPGIELGSDEWRLVEAYRSMTEAQRKALWESINDQQRAK